jgi:hypothetical protein
MPTTELVPSQYEVGVFKTFFFSLSYLEKLKMSRSATHALLRLNKPFEGLPRDLRFAAFWGTGFFLTHKAQILYRTR